MSREADLVFDLEKTRQWAISAEKKVDYLNEEMKRAVDIMKNALKDVEHSVAEADAAKNALAALRESNIKAAATIIDNLDYWGVASFMIMMRGNDDVFHMSIDDLRKKLTYFVNTTGRWPQENEYLNNKTRIANASDANMRELIKYSNGSITSDELRNEVLEWFETTLALPHWF